MFGIGTQELLLILLVVLLLFGGKKIPELMTGLGKGVRSFKKAMSEPDAEEAAAAKNNAAKTEAIEASGKEEAASLDKKKEKTEA
jgi:sec-independent protein translocase protein TatA